MPLHVILNQILEECKNYFLVNNNNKQKKKKKRLF